MSPADTSVRHNLLESWLQDLWSRSGTDLIISGGSSPRMRIDGDLLELNERPLTSDEILNEVLPGLAPTIAQRLVEERDVDFSFSWHEMARIRGNAFYQRGEISVALRIVPRHIRSLADLGVPESIGKLARLDRGLVLVTGPTGSGKSTTLAALVDDINQQRARHVLTLEDPIEYLHDNARSLISQREIGVDAPSFARALRAAFREDPDVLLIGEMRDLESIQIALTMAETGHLVFATLHTNDSVQAIDRIVDVFPAENQAQIRVQLSATLAGVVAQRLIRRVDGGLVAAFELLVANYAVRNLIRERKTSQLRNAITMGRQEGMMTLESSLAQLIERGVIDETTAVEVSAHPEELHWPKSSSQRELQTSARR